MPFEIVKTTGGLISGAGKDNQDIKIFKGIPYAAPPVGELRWKAPQPVITWEGVRKCDKFSKTSIQGGRSANPFSLFYDKEFYPEKMPMSEDCLYLNVWTPAKSEDEKLPVMMWIHGGGFGGGYGHELEFDGEGFARKGVILVTINYRTGVFGFMAHPELSAESENKMSGNYGILDQITALKWISENIAAFGGDPGNITIFGQSAGAKSVEILISSPLTKGRISRAIMQSGGGVNAIDSLMPLDDAEKIGLEICDFLKAGSIQKLRRMPAEDIHNSIMEFRPHTVKTGMLFLVPNIDRYILPENTSEIILKGRHHDIPYILGYNRSETAGLPTMTAGVTAFADIQAGLGRSSTYVYRFERDLPGDDSGSFHSGELWYVFGTLDRCWRPFKECDHELSARMLGYWSNFSKNGNPNGEGLPVWTSYTKKSGRIMSLGEITGMIENK